MKIKKTATLALCILLSGCIGGQKESQIDTPVKESSIEPSFKIDTRGVKQKYSPGEEINLQITTGMDLSIDSVRYWINDLEIKKSIGNTLVTHKFTSEPFGLQSFKACVYNEDGVAETTLSVNLLPKNPPKNLKYQIVSTYPHDIRAYTQGLEFIGDQLMESTGNGLGESGKKGRSSIRIVNPKTGIPTNIVELNDEIFGEGATILNGNIYQLTYKHNLAYVYDAKTLKQIKTLPYFQPMEGWGLTNDGKYLYMSDGSEKIYLLEPSTFSKVNYINVASDQELVSGTNEMEWVKGKIYANFYMENVVGVINPQDGTLESILDLSDLRGRVSPHIDLDVLNGIAFDSRNGTFFVTGKNWDKMFEIKIVED
ncbi:MULTISPECIES: glutaminyl-peptide cyclotransferase [Sphingobacterium]|uniref:glutaminyl-peptide cyclotransferase n=1 Tax=Sphingobacterium TaxID=28453 RepID=UPI001969F7B1|nr:MULTISPECIES: glutaminyl-peptide cyclotransferase [unclassified Sphingobacterium]